MTAGGSPGMNAVSVGHSGSAGMEYDSAAAADSAAERSSAETVMYECCPPAAPCTPAADPPAAAGVSVRRREGDPATKVGRKHYCVPYTRVKLNPSIPS